MKCAKYTKSQTDRAQLLSIYAQMIRLFIKPAVCSRKPKKAPLKRGSPRYAKTKASSQPRTKYARPNVDALILAKCVCQASPLPLIQHIQYQMSMPGQTPAAAHRTPLCQANARYLHQKQHWVQPKLAATTPILYLLVTPCQCSMHAQIRNPARCCVPTAQPASHDGLTILLRIPLFCSRLVVRLVHTVTLLVTPLAAIIADHLSVMLLGELLLV